MDTDKQKDYLEKWKAMRAEMQAKNEKLDAEMRMKNNDAFDNFEKEVEAAGDWVEADWDQFKARVTKWWNELEIKGHEATE